MATNPEHENLPPPRRRRITFTGTIRAFAIVTVVLVVFLVAFGVSVGGGDPLIRGTNEVTAGGLTFNYSQEWERMERKAYRRLRIREGDERIVEAALCPPIRRGRVPFPCLPQPGYLYVLLIADDDVASLDTIKDGFIDELSAERDDFGLNQAQLRLTRDNTEYLYLEFSFTRTENGETDKFKGLIAAYRTGTGIVYLFAEGPDPAFRAVRQSILRMMKSARESD